MLYDSSDSFYTKLGLHRLDLHHGQESMANSMAIHINNIDLIVKPIE